MSTVIPPNVRHMILCDDALPDPQSPGRLKVNGLIPLLRWPKESTTPLHLERLTVLLILADGRGSGRGWVDCIDEETGTLISQSGELAIQFAGKDPSLPISGRFVLRDCYFTRPGAYLVRFLLDHKVISQQPLIVR